MMIRPHSRTNWMVRGRSSVKVVAAIALVAVLSATVGCQDPAVDKEARMPQGYIYYCDGSGAGIVFNWQGGIRDGLIAAGYPGTGESFRWQTGFGVVADHTSDVKYKREKATAMVKEIKAYKAKYPNGPVNLMALSAGSAVLVYALEQLPAGMMVDNAFLFGASISASYDLTKALEHVKYGFFVYTSAQDGVVGGLVPAVGTADRVNVKGAALEGFKAPARVNDRTRKHYAKVIHIPWSKTFVRVGNAGGHTSGVNKDFIWEFVAPLMMTAKDYKPPKPGPKENTVSPAFELWKPYRQGSYVVYKGTETIGGKSEPIHYRMLLAKKLPDRVFIEDEVVPDAPNEVPHTQGFMARLHAEAGDSPLSHPKAKITKGKDEYIQVMGKKRLCQVQKVVVDVDYGDLGRDLDGKIYTAKDLDWPWAALEFTYESLGTKYTYKVALEDMKLQKEPAKGK